MTNQLTIEHYSLTYDGGALKLKDTVSNATVCIRPNELDLLMELISRVSWERRSSARIPVVDGVITVHLGVAAGVVPVDPIDVSAGGMQVSWRDGDLPTVDVNELVTVHIAYRNEKATGAGLVRRVDGRTLGISFIDDGAIDNTRVRKVLDAFETEWLDQRIFGRPVK